MEILIFTWPWPLRQQVQVTLSLRVNQFQAENELRFAQADYDKQVEITRLLMEGLASIQGYRITTQHYCQILLDLLIIYLAVMW